jgi:3-oxoacyl-[acyl-carrier protein] reductase
MKVVLVSGGSKGLGAGIVEHFLQRNYKVASCARSSSSQYKTCKKESPDTFYF